MNAQTIIASACDLARNKHASAHVNAAQARLIAALIENPPPAFELYPTADQFEEAAELVQKKIAPFMDDWLHAIAVDAADNATIPIVVRDRAFIITGAIGDCGLISDLGEAAERLREDAMENA